MGHNQITDKGIPPNTFNVTGLVELDLSYNKLERIPPVSATLEHLYLQANQIKGRAQTQKHTLQWQRINSENKVCLSLSIYLSPEFTLGSFCSVVDVMNYSTLRTLRLDGHEISAQDVPSDSALCLRLAATIEL